MQANIWFKITELPLVIDFRMYCYLFLSFILQFLVFYFIRLTQALQNNYQLGIRLSIAQLCMLTWKFQHRKSADSNLFRKLWFKPPCNVIN